jgi:hypothetical protein
MAKKEIQIKKKIKELSQVRSFVWSFMRALEAMAYSKALDCRAAIIGL